MTPICVQETWFSAKHTPLGNTAIPCSSTERKNDHGLVFKNDETKTSLVVSPTPLKNMLVKMGSSSPNSGENSKKYLSCHHLETAFVTEVGDANSCLLRAPPEV